MVERTEKQRMLKGDMYNSMDPELIKLRGVAHKLCAEYNQLLETEEDQRQAITN